MLMKIFTIIKTAIQITSLQLLIFFYEFLFLLFYCQELLPSVYRLWERTLRQSPYRASYEDQLKKQIDKEELELIYGEILLPTIDKIFHHLELDHRDYLIDLGSGRGRIVLLAAAKGIPSLGLELLPSLVETARYAAVHHLPLASFEEIDILNADLSKATVLWLSGTCLQPETREKIAQKITQLPIGTRLISVSLPLQHKYLPVETIYHGWTTWGRSPFYIQRVISKT